MTSSPRSGGPSGPASPCRAFVAGFGKPGLRDLDFGRQVVDWLQQLDWPDEVVVEDLSCSVPLVLHRLQELRPAKVVLLGAVGRGVDPPGAVRRYRADLGAAREEQVGDEALVDIDHTLAVARQWGGLPVDTVVIEVEPAETGFGLGFSEALASCFDPILDMVHQELEDVVGDAGTPPALDAAALTGGQPVEAGEPSAEPWEPTEAMADLLRSTPAGTPRPGPSPPGPLPCSTGRGARRPAWRSPAGSVRGACASKRVATGSTPSPSTMAVSASWWATSPGGGSRWRPP